MTSDKYNITNTNSVQAALGEMERLAAADGMDDMAVRRMRRLADALLQLGKGLDEVVETNLWLETKGREAALHLKVTCVVDVSEEEELQKLSTTGKNTERKGLWNKIKGVFEEMAIADNEELRTTGYVPELEYGAETYPVLWSFAPYTLGTPMRESWNDAAAEGVKRLADKVDVGFASDEVHIAAYMGF